MKLIVFAALVALAVADNYRTFYKQSRSYMAPIYGVNKKNDYDSYSANPRSFAWDVNDDYAYVNMGHKEKSDGKVTSGSYHVALPDGRIQTVTYKADDYGYVADVTYDGQVKTYTSPTYPAPIYRSPSYVTAQKYAY